MILLLVLQVQLSPLFNLPKSHLQCFGESVYCIGNDLLGRCNKGESPQDRFTAVVSWSISILRPMIFGIAPYNPILGETHHVSRGNLNVLLEQVLLFVFSAEPLLENGCLMIILASNYAAMLAKLEHDLTTTWQVAKWWIFYAYIA